MATLMPAGRENSVLWLLLPRGKSPRNFRARTFRDNSAPSGLGLSSVSSAAIPVSRPFSYSSARSRRFKIPMILLLGESLPRHRGAFPRAAYPIGPSFRVNEFVGSRSVRLAGARRWRAAGRGRPRRRLCIAR